MAVHSANESISSFAERARVSSKLERLSVWLSRALLTGGAQTAVQLLGFVAGIIVIRLCTPEQYAYYTIANAALGVMTVMSDSGTGNAVIAQGGQVWQDRARFGAVLASGLMLRKRLALIVVPVAVPLTVLLLRNQGASWIEAALVAVAILPGFYSTVTGQLLDIVPRLHQHLMPLQRIQLATNFARAVLIGLVLLRWPFALAALLATALPQWWANWRLRGIADAYTDWRGAGTAEARAPIWAQVRRTIPSALYYALSGQLTVWLMSVFGPTHAVAAVGALTRLTMVLNILGTVCTLLIIPRFARIPAAERGLVWRRYWQVQALVAAVCVTAVVAVALFPGPVLAILGPHYPGLEREALLMTVSSVAGAMSGLAYILGASRGAVCSPLVVVPYCLIGQIVLIVLLPVDTISGVIWVSIVSTASQWLLHTLYFVLASRRKGVTPT